MKAGRDRAAAASVGAAAVRAPLKAPAPFGGQEPERVTPPRRRYVRRARVPWLLAVLACIGVLPAGVRAQRDPADASPVWVDGEGVLRWSATGEEVTAFGVNYSIPFAHGYRAIEYIGADHEETIDDDVYHFARMGLDAYRIHVWDIEISDQRGNLLENDHLRLLDYLIMRLKERGIRIVLTLMRNDDNAYPEREADVLGWGFSRVYGEEVAHHTPEAVVLQANYARQFVSHVNTYTGQAYKDDPDILAFEINNEPPHNNSVEDVRGYVNTMVAAMRETGLEKPIFYNMSHNFGVTEAFLTADIQGGTFQWYPTGLNAGFTQRGNFLPNVDFYRIPFADEPGFQDKGLLVYEFSAADVTDNYLYPAMVRAFRERGFQFITQFAYDAMALGAINSEYKTHHLSLAHTPSKGISFMIAGEVARRVPRGASYGRHPDNATFGPFRVSYEENLAEMVTAEAFLYSNRTETRPPDPARLERVAGVGSSPVVAYEGTGAYFLDRLEPGVWRLEVMPDAFQVADPFDDPRLDRSVTRIVWNTWPMTISLPDLGQGFHVRGVNPGNRATDVADGQTVSVSPGAYILTRRGVSGDAWSSDRSYGVLHVGEFVAPTPSGAGITVLHEPAAEAPDGPFVIRAEVVSARSPGAVELVYTVADRGELRPRPTMHAYRPIRMPMQRVAGYTWQAIVPDSLTTAGGSILYHVVVDGPDGPRTWPGDYAGRPGDWDYTNEAYWGTRFVAPEAPLVLLDPDRDYDRVLPLRTRWRTFVRKQLVYGSAPGTRALRLSGNLPLGQYLFLREFVGDEVGARREHMAGFTHVAVRGRSRSADTRTLQFGLLTADGYTYAAPLELSPEWATVRIPLAGLEQTGTALRLAYPQMMPTYFVPERAIPFDPTRIEQWEISTAEVFGAGQLDYEVESIWLER